MAEIIINRDDVDIQTETTFKQYVISQIEVFNAEKFSIRDYYLSEPVARELMIEIVQYNPQFFYFNATGSGITYSTNHYNETGEKYATSVYPSYIDDAENKATFVEQVADEIISGIDDSMSDIEKALYIHDYLVDNYKYDERVYEDPYSTVYDIYGFFEQGVGAAQAYTQAYQYIMQYKLGIITTTATSYSMGHIWNVIKINGNWYHVDVTWDDPIPNVDGFVNHKFFLVSDSRISYNDDGSQSHYDWEYPRIYGDIQCSDTTYDSYWWREISNQIFYFQFMWYSIDSESLLTSRKIDGTVINSYQTKKDVWYLYGSDTVYWIGNYTRLLSANDILIYNTSEYIYAISLEFKYNTEIAHIPKNEHNGYLIYNMTIENGMLYAILQNNPRVGDDGTPVITEKVFVCNVNDIVLKKSLKNIQRGNKIPNEIYKVVNGEMKKAVAVYRVVNGELIKFWEE